MSNKPKYAVQHKNEFLKKLLPLHFTQNEHDIAWDWWKSHECYLSIKNDADAILSECDAMLPILKVHPSTIAHTINICCPYCKQEKNVYDDDVWP